MTNIDHARGFIWGGIASAVFIGAMQVLTLRPAAQQPARNISGVCVAKSERTGQPIAVAFLKGAGVLLALPEGVSSDRIDLICRLE